MKPEMPPSRSWIRLKRHETPGEDYFEGFLREFHRRQRAALLSRSSLSLFLERVKTYLEDPGGPKWAYTPVVAIFSLAVYALVAAASEPEMTQMPFVDAGGWGEVSLVSSVGVPVVTPSHSQESSEPVEHTVFAPESSFEDIRLIEFR